LDSTSAKRDVCKNKRLRGTLKEGTEKRRPRAIEPPEVGGGRRGVKARSSEPRKKQREKARHYKKSRETLHGRTGGVIRCTKGC